MSRAASPELVRKSGIPLPKARRASNPSVTGSSIRSRILPPPSPPTSPSDSSPQPSPPRTTSPRSSPRNIRWEPHERPQPIERPATVGFEVGKGIERMASTESMKENERFSPIPWMMSPPLSPPPLSLYNSAMVHYHVHTGISSSSNTEPTETVIPFPTAPAEIATVLGLRHSSELTRAETPDPNTSITTTATTSPEASHDSNEPRSPSPSPPRAPSRTTTRDLPAAQPLEAFQAVEKAILASPYIIPQDLLPTKPNPASSQSQQQPSEPQRATDDQPESSRTKEGEQADLSTIKENDHSIDMSMSKSRESEFFGELKLRGSQGRYTKKSKKPKPSISSTMGTSAFIEINPDEADISETDSLADLVADYSFQDNNDGNLQSSPFLEYTGPKKAPVNLDDEDKEEQMGLSLYLKSPPPSPQRTFGGRGKDEEETLVEGGGRRETVEGGLKRNTSIQRKGQEYLQQFLARKYPSATSPIVTTTSNTSAKSPAPLVRRRRLRISPTNILLSILMILSLAINIFLFTKLYEYHSPPIHRLEDIMSPGKVGETFDIFTPSTKWWQLYHLKSKPTEDLPVVIPSRATRISHSWKQHWDNRQNEWEALQNEWARWKGWGMKQRRRRLRWRHEDSVIDAFGRAQIMVYGVLQRVLGL